MQPESGRVEIIRSLTSSALLLRLRGELDLSTARQAGAGLVDAAAALPPPGLVVLDLTDLTMLAAIGVGILGGFADYCAQRGVSTRIVVDEDSIVCRVIQITRRTHRIPVFATLEQALPAGPIA